MKTTALFKTAAACAAFCFAAAAAVAAEPEKAQPQKTEQPEAKKEVKKAPLDIRLPRPIFVGTPANIRTPNLEPDKGGQLRPPFLAPEGAKNAALGKPVTSSDKDPIIGAISFVTDGNKEGMDGEFVALNAGAQYVQIDLGALYNIYAILFWHYTIEQRVYHDVIVRVAEDLDFIKNTKTLFNNDHDNSSGLGVGKDYEYVGVYEGKLVDAGGVKARYVRVYSNGNTSDDFNHYVEVEVFGLPADN